MEYGHTIAQPAILPAQRKISPIRALLEDLEIFSVHVAIVVEVLPRAIAVAGVAETVAIGILLAWV